MNTPIQVSYSVDEWMKILEPMAGEPMELIAALILGALDGYHNTDDKSLARDCGDLGNALQAWERLGRV